MPIKSITDFTFSTKIVIKFSAEWYGPCKVISPFYNSLSEKFTNIIFYEVDTDKNEEIADKYKIKSLPTFIFLCDNKEVNRMVGIDKEKLETCLKDL